MKKKIIIMLTVLTASFMFAPAAFSQANREGIDFATDTFFIKAVDPVSLGNAKPKYFAFHAGNKYFFSSARNMKLFQQDPNKYADRVNIVDLQAYSFGFAPASIRIKKGDILRINLTSRDLKHGFYLREYGLNYTIKTRELKTLEFVADRAGSFTYLSNIYSGYGQDQMKGMLVVYEQEEKEAEDKKDAEPQAEK